MQCSYFRRGKCLFGHEASGTMSEGLYRCGRDGIVGKESGEGFRGGGERLDDVRG